jgi:signal transduction histidine kinase
VPLGYLLAVEILSIFVLSQLIRASIPRLIVIFAILAIGAIPFSFWVFSTIERQHRNLVLDAQILLRRNKELAAVNKAISSISGALDLSEVLQNITDAARELIHSRYAALGVADDKGRILEFFTSGITKAQRAAIGPLPEGHGLLGLLIRKAEPLRIRHISKDPSSVGFPPNHPPMKCFLGVPILYQDRPVGDLYLTEKIGADEFTEQDQQLLILLARHAAVAIENARLYEEVRTARDRLQSWSLELEARVAERTHEIQRYSQELTTRVLQAQEEERKRIARELHDETAQSLSSLLISLDVLEPLIPTTGDESLRAGFDRIRTVAKRTLDETRALSHALRPTILDDFGLIAAIHWFADEFTQNFKVPVAVEIDPKAPKRLAPELELSLFRIVQETLNNSGKYAQASQIHVKLNFPDHAAQLIVEDDGTGFNPEEVAGPTRQGGLGLYGMRERATLVGAELKIESEPGKGTKVTVVAPLNRDEHFAAGPEDVKAAAQ